jgi:porin
MGFFQTTKLPCMAALLFFAHAGFGQTPAGDAAAPLLERDAMTGEWFGARPLIEDHGVTFNAGYTCDAMGVVAGGGPDGTFYAGLLDFGVDADFEKLFGWEGGSFQTTWLWLSGSGPVEQLANSPLGLSGIAGYPTLRMRELWLQQEFLGEKISLRLGQLAADSEFFISDYAGLFVNSTFGWPLITSANLPSGGPASPMGTPGVRLAIEAADWLSFRTAAFQGNVFPQDENLHGFDYSLNAQTGFTFLAEAEVSWGQQKDSDTLPGYFKPGAWFQTGESADPLSAQTSAGNCGFYAVGDQMLLREKGDEGLGFFGRVSFAPPDRNVYSFYFDTGLTYRGLVPGRDGDTAGIAFSFAKTTPGWDQAISASGGIPGGSQTVLEATYQIEIAPWFLLQPDLQFIIQPAGQSNLANSLALGVRATLVF